MKLIRELRWGSPKSFKTGAVVGTYPKPMLYLGFDVDGVSVIPSAKQPVNPALIKFNVTHEEIVQCEPGKLREWAAKPESAQPKVLCVDYTSIRPNKLSLEYNPIKDQLALNKFQHPDTGDFNCLQAATLPWKTIVFDGITGYSEVILSHFSSMNPNRMADARDWAFQVGQMCKRLCTAITTLKAHVVVLMHDETEKNDINGQVNTIPLVHGKDMKNMVGGLFSQYFYSAMQNGKPVVWSKDKMFVKGVGTRWPIIDQDSAPDFNSIYGKELL
jgi:hypothetical protein